MPPEQDRTKCCDFATCKLVTLSASELESRWRSDADVEAGREDGDCLIILDECHKAKRLVNSGGSAHRTYPSAFTAVIDHLKLSLCCVLIAPACTRVQLRVTCAMLGCLAIRKVMERREIADLGGPCIELACLTCAEPSETGMAVKALQALLPRARVLYSSATGASEPTNLAYMTRIGSWGFRTMLDMIRTLGRCLLIRLQFSVASVVTCVLMDMHGIRLSDSYAAWPCLCGNL